MKGLIGAAFVAGALVVAGPAAISPAAAAPQAKTQNAGTSDATDFSAHRHSGATIVITATIARITGPITTIGRSTIGRIPILRRRRSPSASGLVRSLVVSAHIRQRAKYTSLRFTLLAFLRAFIFAVGAFMARSRACL